MNSDETTKEVFIKLYDDAIDEPASSSLDSKLIPELKATQSRYEDIEPLAEGGMKKIWAAKDLLTERVVAKAVIKKQGSPEDLEDFIREARITASLEHPNIVPIHDIGLMEEDQPFFTMKKLGGKTLEDIIVDNSEDVSSISRAELLEIFLKICDAVAFAHSKGVLHLDLKPSNIQVDEFGEVLVCDWGLAQNTDDLKSAIPGEVRGSPGFMAPEQIVSGVLNQRSDIYSLGAMLYYILTSHIPVKEGNTQEVLMRTAKGDIIPIHLRAPKSKISLGMAAVTMKALEGRPEDRYQQVSELAKDVFSFTKGFAPDAEEASFLKHFYLLLKRHRSMSLTVAVFTLLLIYLNYSYILSLDKEKKNAIDARDEAEKARYITEKSQKELLLAQEESTSIRQISAPLLVNHALSKFGKEEYPKALEILKTAMLLDPEYNYGRFYQGVFYLGEHEFSKALKTFKTCQGSVAINKYIDFVNKCLSLQKVGNFYNGTIAHELFLDIQKLPSPWGINWHFLNSYTSYPHSPEKKFSFAKEFLSKFTKNTFVYNLLKVEEKYHLSLARNSSLYTIRMLKKLPISELDLTGTTIKDISPLKGMPLEKLILKNTNVSEIESLKGLPLKYLDLSGTTAGWLKPLENSAIETLILGDKWVDINVFQSMQKLKRIGLSKTLLSKKTIDALKIKYDVFFID
ncbi:MAG: protein kinase [Lentisphaeraceae bacterium]|nr:protein kinase [Lentisphaeraceae bacterium]